MNEVQKCLICGGAVGKLRRKYCSKRCLNKAKRIKFRAAHPAPKPDAQTRAELRNPEGYNRPYTEDTAFLIRKWHAEGMTVADIAVLLSRSRENVMMALGGDARVGA